MIALLGRLAYQLIENQFAMLLECAQALFKRKEQRLCQLWGLARVKRVLNDYTLANNLDCQFGDVPVGLGKMLLFLSAIHGFARNPRGQLHWARAGSYHGVGPARFGSYRKPMGVWGRFRIYRPSSMPSFGLRRCDRRHKLLFEYPIIFWTA